MNGNVEVNKNENVKKLLISLFIILIIAIITVFFVFKVINIKVDSKKNIAESSVVEAAGLYSKDVENNKWKSIDKNENSDDKEYEYFCITVEELLNMGVLKDDEVKHFDYSYDTYVVVSRDKLTKVIENKEFVGKNSPALIKELCTGNSENSEDYVPKIIDKKIYTDEINISVDYKELEKVEKNKKDTIKKVTCMYSDNSSNLDKEIKYKDDTCSITNLESNKDYWIRVCVETKNVKSACTTTKKYTTKNIESPNIELNNVIDISYKSTHIKNNEVYYYFKLTEAGFSENEVYKCNDNDNFNCNGKGTKELEKDVWYKTSINKVSIKSLSGSGKIIARTTDKSNNYKETEKEFNVRKITFKLGDADKIDEQTNDLERTCLTEKGKTCEITSPSIIKHDSEIIGWNTNKDAEDSIWNVSTKKEINEDSVYYPIIKQKPIYIYYHSNGGEVTKNTKAGKWTVNKDGIIELNGKSNFHIIKAKDVTNNDGLTNYNNPNYLNITNKGMVAKKGYEWNTKADGTGNSFNQNYLYTYNELVKHAKIENNSYRIDLYVNWISKEYTINYYLGTGSSEGGNELLGKTNCKYNEECQLVKFSGFNKEFPLKEKGWEFYGWLETNSILNENKISLDYRDGQKFVYDIDKDINLYGIGFREISLYNGVKPNSPYKTLGQHWNPYKNTTDNKYCGYFNLPKYSEKINGWEFIGYKSGSNAANDKITKGFAATNLGTKTTLSPDQSNKLRGIYKRVLILSFDPNGGTGNIGILKANQYYNTGYSSNGKNIGSTVNIIRLPLPINRFVAPEGKEFAYWAELPQGGKTYNSGDFITISPLVTEKTLNTKLYAIWRNVDSTPPTNGRISINSGAQYTNRERVRLTLFANDATKMCISLTNTCTTNWKDYSTSSEITLPSTSGNKTVYVWYKDANGNVTDAIKDTIYLDLIKPSILLKISTNKGPDNLPIYKSVVITATVNDISGISSTMYCITKNENCTPSIRGESVSLPSGSNKACFRTRDNAGNYSDTKCTQLFDIEKDTEQSTMANHLLSNNVAGLIKQKLRTDNLYRFSGTSGNTGINNYICLGSSEQTCTDGSVNMYRIIGVDPVTGYIKVIKQTKSTERSEMWYHTNGINVNWYTGISNNQVYSDFYNKVNKIWYNSVPFNTKIVEHTWYVGDVRSQTLTNRNSVISAIQKKQITSKVGIMSLMDYYLAYNDDVDYINANFNNTNWIGLYNNHCTNCYEWTMTRDEYIEGSTNGTTIWRIHPREGVGYYNAIQSYYYRPTFYLDSDIIYKSGTGTSSNPFIITY